MKAIAKIAFKTARIIALLDFLSAVHYMIYFIYQFIVDSILTGTLEPTNDQFPNVSDFIAQLVRPSHRFREVTSSNPVDVLKFSGFSTRLPIARIIALLD